MNAAPATSPKTVLVVDDSHVMRRLVSEIVETDPDFRVVDVAENGRVALQKAREHRPDCILLDIEMPEMSGLDTLRRLGLRSPSKVVIISHLGYEGSRARAEAFRLGAADVIDKPSGSVSRDLKAARGTLINQTLRRVLGLPAIAEDAPRPLGITASVGASALLPFVVDAIGTGVLVFDPAGALAYANAAAVRYLGRPLEIGGTTAREVFADEDAALAHEIEDVRATREPRMHRIISYVGPRRVRRRFDLSVVPIADAGLFVLIDDVDRGGEAP